jgi:hypothetical protein
VDPLACPPATEVTEADDVALVCSVPPPACKVVPVAAPVFTGSVLTGFEATAGAVNESEADIARKLDDALSELLS